MTNGKYKIREILGDWALDIPFPGSVFTIFFNSRVNAELVKKILIHEDEHPNEAVPFNPCTYTLVHIDREKWGPCGELCRNNCMTCDHNADELFGDADYCKDCHGCSKWESSVHKFCELCRRPKTPEAWDELEKRMRG